MNMQRSAKSIKADPAKDPRPHPDRPDAPVSFTFIHEELIHF